MCVCVCVCTLYIGVSEQALGWFPLGLGLVVDEPSEPCITVEYITTIIMHVYCTVFFLITVPKQII